MIGTPRNYFYVTFPNVPKPVADVWGILAQHLLSHQASYKRWSLSGTIRHPFPHLSTARDYKADSASVERILREKNLDAFEVVSGRYENETRVNYSLLNSLNWDTPSGDTILSCTLEPNCKSLLDWSPVIENVMEKWGGILGWQAFWPYLLWQGRTNVEDYEVQMGEIPPPAIQDGTNQILWVFGQDGSISTHRLTQEGTKS